MARFTHIWKTGVVVTALLATVVACGNSDASRARNVALVAGTTCTKPGQISKISKVAVVCGKTKTGNIWYPTMKSNGRSVSCKRTVAAVRKKKSVVWVCGVAKGKKLWFATSPLPPVVLQATAVVIPGVSEPVPVLESTDVATPSRPVVADNNVLANPTIADEPPITTPVTIATVPSAPAANPPISYKVGETGPGGGTIFYVDMARDAGSQYFEVACTGWSDGTCGGTDLTDPVFAWAVTASAGTDVASIANNSSAYNNVLGIGLGYKNSLAIVAQGNNVTTAAGAARAYLGGSQSDWYLPSTAELNVLCQWARNVAQSVTTPCMYGTLNTGTGLGGGFATDRYWSSSEDVANAAWYQYFNNGGQTRANKGLNSFHVRPVRAF